MCINCTVHILVQTMPMGPVVYTVLIVSCPYLKFATKGLFQLGLWKVSIHRRPTQ